MSADDGADPVAATITVCPDGPLLVRGSVSIVDADGALIPQGRPTVALCRCGKSRIAPLCDGMHKLLRSRVGAERAGAERVGGARFGRAGDDEAESA